MRSSISTHWFGFALVFLCLLNTQCMSNKDIVELLQRAPDKEIVVLKCDKLWETKFDYATILHTDIGYVMYYRAMHFKQFPKLVYCRAVSKDGIHWEKPNVCKFSFNGSIANNIISDKIDGVSVEYVNGVYWLLADRLYEYPDKQIRGLVLFRSDDGINFEKYEKFDVPYFCDSQNEIMWDPTSRTFKFYLRSWYKSESRSINFHHSHQLYRAVSLLETPSLYYSLPVSASPMRLAGKTEPPSINNELPMVIRNNSLNEDFDIYGGYVHKYRDSLYIAYPINYYHTDDVKHGGKKDNDGYATIGFWTSKDGRTFEEIERNYITDGENWLESCIGHVETNNSFIHYYITFNGSHVRQVGNNVIKARIHYKNKFKRFFASLFN